MKIKPIILGTITLILTINLIIKAQGTVYLVLGSDTGIWNGANTAQYHNYYHQDLYTEKSDNTYKVMSSSFREPIRDSYGNTLKLTWWMHGGNMFRYATNNNVPYSNTIALHLMKKYHGEAIEQWGDELTLHYHTWDWTDYNGDGKYFWNQTKTFAECREDFDFTLAQYLLEEDVFPVSFRSGWHYMDNRWQNYLDELLPYSMHNDYPTYNTDNEEPLDNIIDWSEAPRQWYPFHPSGENYQHIGDLNGWNLRSEFLGSVNQNMMNTIFENAAGGTDQMACLWAHLPENDFLENIERIGKLAHKADSLYPDAKFRYVTAVEAMQMWLETQDSETPQVTLTQDLTGNELEVTIQTDEEIFQEQPFVAVKNIYEDFNIIQCEKMSENKWKTAEPLNRDILAKLGVAVTDTAGNLTTKFIKFLPDDIYLDDNSSRFITLDGEWETRSNTAWGTTAREASISQGDSASAGWDFTVNSSANYNLFFQMPDMESPLTELVFEIRSYGEVIKADTVKYNNKAREWKYICNTDLDEDKNYGLLIKGLNNSNEVKTIAADVIKLTPLVKDYDVEMKPVFADFGEVSEGDTASIDFEIANFGNKVLKIEDMQLNEEVFVTQNLPFQVAPFGKEEIQLHFTSEERGVVNDSIRITTNDPMNTNIVLPYSANVKKYFEIIDNEDSTKYTEKGDWQTSVTQAYGTSSRYVFLSGNKGAYAEFSTKLDMEGEYSIEELVPNTTNSANNALYVVEASGDPVDSAYINQNINSGNWVTVSQTILPADTPVSVKVINDGTSTDGDVLRADAVKIQLLEEITGIKEGDLAKPTEFKLHQNYPNPFNPSTHIKFSIPKSTDVKIVVYDVLGREIRTLLNANKQAGNYQIRFNASGLSGGIYFYTLETGSTSITKKMIYLK